MVLREIRCELKNILMNILLFLFHQYLQGSNFKSFHGLQNINSTTNSKSFTIFLLQSTVSLAITSDYLQYYKISIINETFFFLLV